MLQINAPIEIIIKAAGKQKIEDKSYRLQTYIQTVEVKDGLLIYNLLTRELVLLAGEEIEAYFKMDSNADVVRYLIENWFLVPEEHDDYTLYHQTHSIMRMIVDNDKTPPLKNFVIYPTTDCNARCFYCFELGCKRITMTEQTAHDVAKFIIKKSDGQSVKCLWFGGEPLYNSKAIDIIIKDISESGIKYSSTMISNGYLFDESLVKKAVDFWNLKTVQITLDGTEEVYNKCKAYIYKNDVSPFVRVTDNIELLLKNNVRVRIRLNMDMHNYSNLRILLDQLFDRYSKYPKCDIYISLLYEKSGKVTTKRNQENKRILWEKFAEFEKLIVDHNMSYGTMIGYLRSKNHCMADNNASTTILPDGSLGKCEHYLEDNYYGSIYSDEINWENINKFKVLGEHDESCHSCPLHPKCHHLKACPNADPECDDLDKELKFTNIKEQIKNTYNQYIKIKTNKLVDNAEDEICS